MTTNLTFGQALEHMRVDNARIGRMCREWEGKSIFLIPGSDFEVSRYPLNEIFPEGTNLRYEPRIDMQGVDENIHVWTPDQLDILSVDWYVLEFMKPFT